MDRRTALKLGAQLGVLGGIGLAGGYQLARIIREGADFGSCAA